MPRPFIKSKHPLSFTKEVRMKPLPPPQGHIVLCRPGLSHSTRMLNLKPLALSFASHLCCANEPTVFKERPVCARARPKSCYLTGLS